MKKRSNEKINNPHDKLFKETMNDPKTAADFLKIYLPEKLSSKLNLKFLEIQKDSFIDSKLKTLQTDLLFKTEYLEHPAYVYILFEHKSYPEKKTGIQLLKYLMSIWEKSLNEQKAIPTVIPIVIYHGNKTWPWDGNLKHLWPNSPDNYIRNYLPNFNYEIYDFSSTIINIAKNNPKISIFLNTLKINYTKNKKEKTAILKEILYNISVIKSDINKEYIETILIYILTIENDINENDLIELAKEISFEGDDLIMTAAERLRKEGYEKGIEKGIQEGFSKGIETTALNMLKFGMSTKDITKTTGLSLEKIEQIKKDYNLV